MLWHLWIGRAKHPGPPSLSTNVGIGFLNVGGWLTHGDFALEVVVDFLAVAEHRLIPARVRVEWSRLRTKGLASIWAPASQDSSHVGNAGVGVVSSWRFMHLVVLYGYQGADVDAEQLAWTDQLFNAAFGELSVVACGQPCLLDPPST